MNRGRGGEGAQLGPATSSSAAGTEVELLAPAPGMP